MVFEASHLSENKADHLSNWDLNLYTPWDKASIQVLYQNHLGFALRFQINNK